MTRPETIPAAAKAVLAGDAARFGEIVARFDAPVRRIVTRQLRDAHAVEDVIQEIWIRVYRQIAALLEAGSPDAWIGRIARNCVVDHHRSRERSERFDALAGDVADDRSVDLGPKSWVWELVDAMPESARDVLDRRYRHGDSYAEIAARLDVPLSTVRGRLYEARGMLRVRIQQRNPR